MEETDKSEALLRYERVERDLFLKLADGRITMSDYQLSALDTMQTFMRGFSVEELLKVQKLMLTRHADAANALAERGHPQPGNDPIVRIDPAPVTWCAKGALIECR